MDRMQNGSETRWVWVQVMSQLSQRLLQSLREAAAAAATMAVRHMMRAEDLVVVPLPGFARQHRARMLLVFEGGCMVILFAGIISTNSRELGFEAAPLNLDDPRCRDPAWGWTENKVQCC